jgi:hypothetical protein
LWFRQTHRHAIVTTREMSTRTPACTTGTHTPLNTTDTISFEEHNPHCMLMLSSSCDFDRHIVMLSSRLVRCRPAR